MRYFLLKLSIVVAFGFPTSMFAQGDPFAGTWKFNRERSTYERGRGPKSETRIIEASGDGEKVVIHVVAANGSSHDTQYKCNFDGKDCPLAGAQGETITRKWVNPNTIESTLKKDGKVLYTTILVVSKDGKTMMIRAKGKDANGKSFDNDVAVYDRQ